MAATFCLGASLPNLALGAEPHPTSAVDHSAVLVLSADRPLRAWSHPLVISLREILGQSRAIQSRLEAPEADRLHQLRRSIEKASGEDWEKTLSRLTSGGVAASVSAKPGAPPDVTLAFAADDTPFLAKTIGSLQSQLLERLPAAVRPASLPTETYRGFSCTRLGEAAYGVKDALFVAASRFDLLKAAIDRTQAAPSEKDRKPTTSLLHLRVNLETLRANPEFAKAIATPSNDVGRVAVFGGWMETLRSADDLTLDVTEADRRFEALLSFHGVDVGKLRSGGERTPSTAVSEPLRIPGTIATLSVNRDFGALWSARQKLLTPEALKRLEEGDEKAGKQLEVVGARFRLSELVGLMGSHFRVVLARQAETVYPIELTEKLPAAVLLFDVKDGFREKLSPVLKFAGLIGAADNNRMDTHVEKHQDVELTSLRTRGDDAQYKTNKIRYQFSPTWGFAHDHFILGSTTEIVRQTIDALEVESRTESRAGTAGMLGLQSVEGAVAAAAVKDFGRAFRDASVLNDGMTTGQAQQELDLLVKAIESAGALNVSTYRLDRSANVKVSLGR